MMTFKLGRLLIQNFKAFKTSILVDLTDCRAAILDGPNGFGKTTVFDALEICFTGKIDRISTSGVSANNKAREGHFLKNDSSKPTIIKLELISSNPDSSFVIKVEIREGIVGAAASIKKYEDHVLRFSAPDWASDAWKPFSEKELGSALGLTNASSLFNVQHYISQEDTAHFLRNHDESQRHSNLSHLFGTSTQTKEREYFESIKEKLAKKRDAQKTKFDGFKEELAAISVSDETEIDATQPRPSQKINIISKLENQPAGLSTLEDLLASLEILLHSTIDSVSYRSLRLNSLIAVLENDRELELNALLRVGCATSFADISRLAGTKLKVEKNLEELKKYRKIQQLVEDDNGALSDHILTDLALRYDKPGVFDQLRERLAKSRQAASNYDRIIQRIVRNRSALFAAYQEHCHERDNDVVECPMCGVVKEDGLHQLEKEYDAHEVFLKRESSAVLTVIEELKNELQNEFVAPASVHISNRISRLIKIESTLPMRLFEEKRVDESTFSKIIKIKAWLGANGIEYVDLIDNKLRSLSDNYIARKTLLKERIQSKRAIVSEMVEIDLEEVKKSCKTLEVPFDDELGGLSEASLRADIDFVKRCIKILRNKEAGRIRGVMNISKKSLETLQKKIKAIDSIIKSYSDNIKKYEIEVASCIAIPFYIYTSKILQTRPDGSGIFLKTPQEGGKEKNPYIRFCARRNDSHDAWCTMSSGQLAGLVISFALAMNRLYPSNLRTVLIDDPVQSMDEINMASLIQLFLHEFPTHQFFVSTHEKDTSSYMSYKFLQNGKKVARINMKSLSYKLN